MYRNQTHPITTVMSEIMPSDNQSSLDLSNDCYIPREKLQTIIFVVGILMIPMFCLLGSLGNILSLVVLIHQRMRNQTNYILAALCVSDTLFLIHSLIFTGLNIYRKKNPIEGEALRANVYPIVGAYGSVVTARITSGLTTLLCAERFVAVYFPMQARYICTKKSTCIAITVIYLTTIIMFIPLRLKYEATETQISENETRTFMNTTNFYKNNKQFYKVYGTLLNVLFRFTPLVILPILNTMMIHAVHKTYKLRKQMSGKDNGLIMRLSSRKGNHCSSNDQNHITIMLLIVSFTFLICILPGAMNSVATHIWPVYSNLGKAKNLYLCISTVTFLLETINSSVNFIIYMAFSRKFRLMYKEIFCCGHGKYYQKISITSVKEKFRWSSAKKTSQNQSNNGSFGRRTVSDCGPLRNLQNKYKIECRRGTCSEGMEVRNGIMFLPTDCHEDIDMDNNLKMDVSKSCPSTCCYSRHNRSDPYIMEMKQKRNSFVISNGTKNTLLTMSKASKVCENGHSVT